MVEPSTPVVYSENWDQYVQAWRPPANRPDAVWPGDEWDTPERWGKLFEQLVASQVGPTLGSIIEIGPGSGKFTERMLERYPSSTVLACDVSKEFLAVLSKRCASFIEAGRCTPVLMEHRSSALMEIADIAGLVGKVDLVISIDAMVHVDLHYLFAYWRDAGQVLKPGGKLIMTVSDPTTQQGFEKLASDSILYFRPRRMLGKFEWISSDIVKSVLGRLGFATEIIQTINRRDCCFVATKQ